jgi:hypothetical protein
VKTIFSIWAHAGLLAATAVFIWLKIALLDRLRGSWSVLLGPFARHRIRAYLPELRRDTPPGMMVEFHQMLNWNLKEGSHSFPGSDGGTCINEAAVVAAGYEYRPIASVEHMPACFSRPICRFALRLNDDASDLERQQLLPFVTRLACADTQEVERKRRDFIALHDKRGLSFRHRLKVLEAALAIGRQADAFGIDEERATDKAIKARAHTHVHF